MTKKKKEQSEKIEVDSNSLRNDRWKSAIFQPLSNEATVFDDVPEEEQYTVFYTMTGEKGAKKSKDGNFLMTEDCAETYAKKVVGGLKERYFVKINRMGHCFNPLGMYEMGKSRQNPKLGERDFRFKEVNLAVFNFYLEFLKTKNNAYLLNAQRSLF